MELESFLKEIFKNCNNVYSYLMSICYEWIKVKIAFLLRLDFYSSGLLTPCLRANIQIQNHIKETKYVT